MSISRHIEALYREESRRVLATLIRLLGDFDLAEEALQDAFAAAVTQWPVDGLPDNPRAWLISAGRFKAIDRLRRRARFDASLEELALRFEQGTEMPDLDLSVEDDRLRLIFTCCHPALSKRRPPVRLWSIDAQWRLLPENRDGLYLPGVRG